MGFAKYHEDDLRIYDDRMYFHNALRNPNIQSGYTRIISRFVYNYYCPFCKCGFLKKKELIDHIVVSHGGVHEIVYLNNQRVYERELSVKQVYSLKLYCYRESPIEIKLQDGMGECYSFRTEVEKIEYDIQSILQGRVYSELRISNIDAPVCIKQQLDISRVSMDKILSGKYASYLFDEQISEELLSPEECLIYIKMLVFEGADTRSFIERLSCMHLDASRELDELYYYHFLQSGSEEGIEDKLPTGVFHPLLALLNGCYSDAEKALNVLKRNQNDRYGCMIILGLLTHDKLEVDYLIRRYQPYGFIGALEQVLYYFSKYDSKGPGIPVHELKELMLFKKYPLIKALMELNDAINHQSSLSYESYSLLRQLTPLAAIHYCYGIDDPDVKEKILKSVVKTHKDSFTIKEYAFSHNYSWMKHRISVSDEELYRKAIIKANEERGRFFSRYFLNCFPYDGQIQITPLGSAYEIGASCFVITYKGYNIMLDCGINVQRFGEAAYPDLDSWNREIDLIVISHAHIDHSGGVPKAHAMWPEANIITTAPTKVFLKYLYSDMAKVKNGITDEFEIENITIEKDVMLDTLNSMTTVEYEEWIELGQNIKLRLHPAGHIIGAAMIELQIDEKILLYTGDFCNFNQVLTTNFNYSALPRNVDYLITESTYVKKESVKWKYQYDQVKSAILKGISSHCAILLPAASIGRSQELVCLIGEMKISGEIPEDIPLYLAGMAIPATTQIAPFMNEHYAKIIGLFEEFDGLSYPEENAVVIASSGSMSKGSASYKIARYWDNHWVKYIIIANGYLDEDFEADERYMNMNNQILRLSLSTHADLRGILELIEYVSPKVISFVHRGTDSKVDLMPLINECKHRFSNDIVVRDLQTNRTDRIFDIYELFMEGAEKND